MMTLMIVLCTLVALCNAQDRFYAEGYDSVDESSGAWTEWMDSDFPTGTAEYEDIIKQKETDADFYKELGTCSVLKMFCDRPIAMDVKPSKHMGSDADWDEIATCTTEQELDPSKGYMCETYQQYVTDSLPDECFDSDDGDKGYCSKNGLNNANGECRKCPNVAVRYFCQGDEAALKDAYCKEVADRQLDKKDWKDNYEKDMLQEMKKKKRSDEKITLAKLLRQVIDDLE